MAKQDTTERSGKVFQLCIGISHANVTKISYRYEKKSEKGVQSPKFRYIMDAILYQPKFLYTALLVSVALSKTERNLGGRSVAHM